MNATSVRSAARPRWRRYLAVASTLLFYLFWILVAAPLIAYGLRVSTELQVMLVGEGWLAVLLALGFTFRGTWEANGFRGGLQLRSWRALWPMWLAAVANLAMSAADRSPKEHLVWLALCFLVGFTEEAVFRGIILRSLVPGGRRSAVLWSAFWFGAFHAGGFISFDGRMVLLTIVGAFAIGLVFAWVRLQSGSIWPCLIAHGFFDYAAFVDSGGFRESMIWTPYHAITSALFATLTLAWACWLLFRKPPLGAPADRGAFADLAAEPTAGA